ncbi:MAG: nucleotidyltransferase [Flavobacteriales bacterium]|nr:MAG: nucleotidyltransferase [Flavobacteriales bacterium]
MHEEQDIRWQQRFSNYNKALKQLEKFVEKEQLNELEEQGLIKAFEYNYELAWKTLQDLLREKGYEDIAGPKPVIRQSFQDGYITDGEGWMKMVQSRNLTSHTYNQETADEIAENIIGTYVGLFIALRQRLEQERSGTQEQIFDND